MLDTAVITLNSDQAGNINFLDETPAYLSDVLTEGNNKHGCFITGILDNLIIRITERKISIKQGSISKYYLQSNFKTLHRGDIESAIEKLSAELHLPIRKGNVFRIDIAQNFIMKYDKKVYINHLGTLRHYERFEHGNGLYYQNSKRQLLFYGKDKEQRIKQQPIPDIYQNRNTLRYEQRFTNRLPKQFKKSEITCNLLYDEAFYCGLVDWWKRDYGNIKKNKLIRLNTHIMKNIKEFRNYYYLLGIKQHYNDATEAKSAIDMLDRMGLFDNRTQKKRIKDEVELAFNLPDISETSEVIQELDRKVDEAVKYYR